VPDSDRYIRWKNTHFQKPFNLSGFIFPKGFVMQNCVFDELLFMMDVFSSGTVFARSIFSNGVAIINSKFTFQTSFVHNKVAGEGIACNSTVFDGSTFFLSSEFNGQAEFRSKFKGEVSFSESSFIEDVNFCSAIFEEVAILEKVKFHKKADFSSVIFERDCCLRSSVFYGIAIFVKATFQRRADFQSVCFRNDVCFDSSIFRGFTDFRSSRFQSVADFSNCHFERPTSFKKAKFVVLFPQFSGAILHQNTAFSIIDDLWPRIDDCLLEESRESLAIIRHCVGKQSLPEEEHYFFRREMAFVARTGSWWERFPVRVYEALSDYGNSIGRPSAALAVALLIGFLPYLWWLTWLPRPEAGAHPVLTSIGFSFSNLFGFLGFNRLYFGNEFLNSLPTVLKVVAAAQTIAGVVLLFFLGLGLRNRFRVK
jgi:uncharacterized protein YjbI with pentapeptide repeats